MFVKILLSCLHKLSDFEFFLYPQKKKYHIREYFLKLSGFQFHTKSIRMGNDVYFKQKGNMSFGRHCCIGSFSRFWNYNQITIGDDFLSAGNLTINTGSHIPETLKSYSQPVRIGNRVWCGVNVTILSGVTIGDDIIIGAGSLVNKDVENGQIVVGVPAKAINKVNRDGIELHRQFNWDEK